MYLRAGGAGVPNVGILQRIVELKNLHNLVVAASDSFVNSFACLEKSVYVYKAQNTQGSQDLLTYCRRLDN